MTTATANKPLAQRPRRMAREPQPKVSGMPRGSNASTDSPDTALKPVPKPAASKAPTKVDLVLSLLVRTEGATLEQMVEATGWLPHTTRAALTGLKKKGHEITSTRADGVRTYHVITAQLVDANVAAEPRSTADV